MTQQQHRTYQQHHTTKQENKHRHNKGKKSIFFSSYDAKTKELPGADGHFPLLPPRFSILSLASLNQFHSIHVQTFCVGQREREEEGGSCRWPKSLYRQARWQTLTIKFRKKFISFRFVRIKYIYFFLVCLGCVCMQFISFRFVRIK